jgi:hypothetical protein
VTNHRLEKPGLRQKLAHEFSEMAWIFLYLALFLCALATYSTLLLREFHLGYFAYGTALLNALIMSKVILLGEYAHLGQRYEDKALLLTAAVKALLFAVLMAVFHVLEEVVKHVIHGHTVASALRELTGGRLTEILVRNLVFFCALVPFFAFRELRRVMGEENFFALLFRRREAGVEGQQVIATGAIERAK